MDLSVATIIAAVPEVEELILCSSGNMDVLAHWVSYEGLYQLLKVRLRHLSHSNIQCKTITRLIIR